MTAATLTIDDKDIIDALDRLLAAAGTLTPVYKNIGEYEAEATKERFRTQQDPDGNAWQKLNDLYALTKKGASILVGPTRDLSSIIWQLASSGVEIGSNVIYARAHNEGATIVPKNAAALMFSMGGQTFMVKKVTIPRRQFLGFSSEDQVRIQEIIEDHFLDAIENTAGSK
jgi:phage virion morphogenesis protein